MTGNKKTPRRVVTGPKFGKSVIIEDCLVENVSEHIPWLIISDVWATDTMPVDIGRELNIN